MKRIVFTIMFILSMNLFAVYSIGDTVDPSDNISWTDNYGYSSDIFREVFIGKPVMIFIGQTW
ncbi:MAG: hypothetical protein KAS62_09635 [Candidatus Delongbacteria bacterium]|nr:hypothetical protein [Candidatus Delongbacteria bacterium]